MSTAQDLLDFWFKADNKKAWFNSTPAFDQEICSRFEADWLAAKDAQRDQWKTNAKGCLALVILLDQFPLNMYRGDPRCFETEAQARAVSTYAIEQGYTATLNDAEKSFLYMPFMHSESLEDQVYSVKLFSTLADNGSWARHHHDIVKQFGRFPHRNAILGRKSSQEEIDWLNSKEAFSG